MKRYPKTAEPADAELTEPAPINPMRFDCAEQMPAQATAMHWREKYQPEPLTPHGRPGRHGKERPLPVGGPEEIYDEDE